MKVTCRIVNLVVFLALFMTVSVRAAMASPRLTLSPSSGSYSNGTTFQVNVGAQTESQKTGGIDIWGTFDATRLEIQSITKIADSSYGFAAISPNINNDSGKFDVALVSNSQSSYDAVAIAGDLIQITFKAKATGTASLNFTCQSGSFTDSNIISSEATNQDLIDCASNQSGSYTITDAVGGDSSTSTPTSAKQLPQTGMETPTIAMLIIGILGIISAAVVRVL